MLMEDRGCSAKPRVPDFGSGRIGDANLPIIPIQHQSRTSPRNHTAYTRWLGYASKKSFAFPIGMGEDKLESTSPLQETVLNRTSPRFESKVLE